MGRSGRLKRPELPEGAHRYFNEQLHLLHRYARYPSLTEMSDDLAAVGVHDSSRATIHNAFASTRLPMPKLADGLVACLTQRVDKLTDKQIDYICNGFKGLWELAEQEDRYGPETVWPEEFVREASEGVWGRTGPLTVDVPALLPAQTRVPTSVVLGLEHDPLKAALPSAEAPQEMPLLQLLRDPEIRQAAAITVQSTISGLLC